MIGHTPGPWSAVAISGGQAIDIITAVNARRYICQTYEGSHNEANARLIAAAPDLLEALMNVRMLISAAAMTGFNCRDGDWADRLFFSQQKTSAAIDKATKQSGSFASPQRQD